MYLIDLPLCICSLLRKLALTFLSLTHNLSFVTVFKCSHAIPLLVLCLTQLPLDVYGLGLTLFEFRAYLCKVPLQHGFLVGENLNVEPEVVALLNLHLLHLYLVPGLAQLGLVASLQAEDFTDYRVDCFIKGVKDLLRDIVVILLLCSSE